jgi:hypothetical protein
LEELGPVIPGPKVIQYSLRWGEEIVSGSVESNVACKRQVRSNYNILLIKENCVIKVAFSSKVVTNRRM